MAGSSGSAAGVVVLLEWQDPRHANNSPFFSSPHQAGPCMHVWCRLVCVQACWQPQPSLPSPPPLHVSRERMHTVVSRDIGDTVWGLGAPNGAPVGRRGRSARRVRPTLGAAALRPSAARGPGVHTQPGATCPLLIDRQMTATGHEPWGWSCRSGCRQGLAGVPGGRRVSRWISRAMKEGGEGEGAGQ
eukprot:366230-Chlamydomonas_euryale.AAC.23